VKWITRERPKTDRITTVNPFVIDLYYSLALLLRAENRQTAAHKISP